MLTMKRTFILVAVSAALLSLSSCADKEAHKNYVDAQKALGTEYFKAASKPLLDLTLPAPDGKEYKLVVNREVDPVLVQQIKDSEWVGPAQSLISAASVVGGLAVALDGAGTRTETVGGDYVKGYQANPTSTVTTTEMAPAP